MRSEIFVLIAFLFLNLSCSKKVANQLSTLKISISSQERSFDPLSTSEINCFGVVIEYPDRGSIDICEQNDETVVPIGTAAGMVAVGEQLSTEAYVGSNRTIRVIGMRVSGGSCPDVGSASPLTTGISHPTVLGQVTTSIEPGGNEISIAGQLNPEKKIIRCSSTLFGGNTSGNTFGMHLGVNSVSDYSVLNSSADEDIPNYMVKHGNYLYAVGFSKGSFIETNPDVGNTGDILILKFDLTGELIWAKHFGNQTAVSSALVQSVSGSDIGVYTRVGPDGYLYVAGHTTSNLFETNAGARDIFLMKLSLSGDLIWGKQIGTTTQTAHADVDDASGDEQVNGMAIDSSNNIYINGTTAGNFADTNGGSTDLFLVKFDSSGNLTFAKHIGSNYVSAVGILSSAAGAENCSSVQIDTADNPIITGHTAGNLVETNGGSDDVFALKFNSSGVVQDAIQIGSVTQAGSAEIINATTLDRIFHSTIDFQNNIYMIGMTGGSLAETFVGVVDGIIIKLDSNLDIVWASQLGNETLSSFNLNDLSGTDVFTQVAINPNNEIVVSMTSNSNITGTASVSDLVFLKYSSSGNLTHVHAFNNSFVAASSLISGNSGNETPVAAQLDEFGNIFVVGYTEQDFIDTTLSSLNDIFLLKLNSDGEL